MTTLVLALRSRQDGHLSSKDFTLVPKGFRLGPGPSPLKEVGGM